MTGLQAAILYRKIHQEDTDWVTDIDEDIIKLLIEGRIKFDPLKDVLYY